MQPIDLRPMVSTEAEIIVDQSEKKIIITSKRELSHPELLLAVMGARNSVDDNSLIGYEIYENGEYVTKVAG